MAFDLVKGKYVRYSPELMDVIRKVHKEINSYDYKTDLENFDKEEHWTQYIEKHGGGDCDDYALSKRRVLMEKGVPWQALCFGICKFPEGYHFVLIVRTTKKAYVLCNNIGTIPSWRSYRVDGIRPKWYSWFQPVKKVWYSFK